MTDLTPADLALASPHAEILGAQVFGADATPEQLLRSENAPGTPAVSIDARGLWLLRGVVDCHTHLAWNAFEEADREDSAAADALSATLRAGVTSARDAGGLSAEEVANAAGGAPRMQLSTLMIGPEYAGRGPGHLNHVVAGIAAAGAQWVKIMATGGLSAPSETVLDPVFTETEIREITAAARDRRLRVMAHAWGGPAIGWLLRAGVASIEHGIFLTRADADAAAAVGVVFVPTVAVYRETAQAAREGEIPAVIGERAARAAERHLEAVALARQAGLPIAVGTDAGTPRQHGANLNEIAALLDSGLGAEEAVDAATVVGARLLWGESGTRLGDAILVDADPRTAAAYRGGAVVAVFQSGRLVHLAEGAAARLTSVGPGSSPHLRHPSRTIPQH